MDSLPDENIKIITIIETKKKSHNKPQPNNNEKNKRMITQTKLWNFTPQELLYSFQKTLLENIDINNPQQEQSKIIKFIKREIQKKIYGYKCQDIKKELFSPSQFVNIENIIQKLKDCNLTCYYCKESIYILYEFVREPQQWTLERINNAEGHNIDNTEIACLKCNLSRRCIFHERYLFTKQISNMIKENIGNP
jgi:hypothetical protein